MATKLGHGDNAADETRAIGIGMVIAAGIIADRYEGAAAEILACCGWTSFADLRAAGVDEYDLKQLRHVIPDLAARERRHRTGGFAAIDRLAA